MDINFTRLNQLAFGYWHAQTLFALTRADVFDLLADGERPAGEIAERCGFDGDAGVALLNAGVALGLLRKSEAETYGNSELAGTLLVSDQPGSLANWVRVMGRWYEPWGTVDEAIRAGEAVDPQSPKLAGDPAYLEEFILGMHEYAARTSDDVAAAIELDGPRRLIDVGGGGGTYSIALCRRYPELHSVVLDLDSVLAITRRIVDSAGLSERVATDTADYRSSAFGEDADAVLLSNVLHQESEAVGADILRRAREALKPSGKVIVHGHFLDEGRTSPVFTTLHNLSARTIWEGGHSYTTSEMVALVEAAGFAEVESAAVPQSATKLITGKRPDR